MKFLWFGKKSFSDLSVKDLENRKTKWSIQRQKTDNVIKQAESRINGYMQAASEPGVSNVEKEAAARHIEEQQKQKDRFERHLQLIQRAVDQINDSIGLKEDEELAGEVAGGGVLGVEIDLEEMDTEISDVVTQIKDYETESDAMAARLQYSTSIDTKSKQSDEFRSIMAEIEKESEKKRSESDL
jgi:hypothetical protein